MTDKTIHVGLDVSCLIPQPLTGVGYYTLHLTHALLAGGFLLEVRLFASGFQKAHSVLTGLAEQCPHARVLRWPTRLKIPLWTRLNWPPMEWYTGPVDVAHGTFHLLPAARRAKRVATIFDLTSLLHPDKHTAASGRVDRRLLRHAAQRADALVAISQSGKNDLVERLHVSPERVHVVLGGVFLEEFQTPFDADAHRALAARLGIARPYLICVGTVEPRKNLVRLLNAYARIRERKGDLPQLALAGKRGWLSDPVFERITSLNLARNVVHTGYLSRTDIVLLLRGAEAFVYPSLYEGFGLPVLEAMAARVPILTSNVSSMPEVVGDTAITVDPESVDAIEAGLWELLEHRDEAQRRVEAAFARAATLTWQHSARALAEVYRKITA